jgi:hypothetical protein
MRHVKHDLCGGSAGHCDHCIRSREQNKLANHADISVSSTLAPASSAQEFAAYSPATKRIFSIIPRVPCRRSRHRQSSDPAVAFATTA